MSGASVPSSSRTIGPTSGREEERRCLVGQFVVFVCFLVVTCPGVPGGWERSSPGPPLCFLDVICGWFLFGYAELTVLRGRRFWDVRSTCVLNEFGFYVVVALTPFRVTPFLKVRGLSGNILIREPAVRVQIGPRLVRQPG